MIYYTDTSALVKRYITEIGSTWVRSITNPSLGNVIVMCEITPVEFFSALSRRLRVGTLTFSAVSVLQNGFLTHYRHEYVSVLLEDTAMTRARDLVNRYPLRTLDAIQLACAVEFANIFGEPATFVSADAALLAAAAGEDCSTDNPLTFP